MNFKNYIWPKIILCGVTAMVFSGCLLAAAGAGAEAGYVVAQDDRTASETLTDQRISTTVKTKLFADSRVSGFDINVDSFRSDVTLKGIVRDAETAQVAINLARSVSGVKSVNSKLVVSP